MTERSQTLAELDQITLRVERLTAMCRLLTDENRSLRFAQDQLATERAQILARNEQARSRVEAMILRLKTLEQNPG